MTSPKQKKQLQISINNHYLKHLSVLETHQQRIMKFMENHEKSIDSIEDKNTVKKATIVLKQQKAHVNKKQAMLSRSRKVEESLIRWKDRVSKHKLL